MRQKEMTMTKSKTKTMSMTKMSTTITIIIRQHHIQMIQQIKHSITQKRCPKQKRKLDDTEYAIKNDSKIKTRLSSQAYERMIENILKRRIEIEGIIGLFDLHSKILLSYLHTLLLCIPQKVIKQVLVPVVFLAVVIVEEG